MTATPAVAPTTLAPGPRQRTRLSSWLDRRFYVLATVPALVVVSVIVAIPLFIGIYLSFTNYTPVRPTFSWGGLVNYDQIYTSPTVHAAIKNTAIFAGAGIVIEMIFGLFFAILLARKFRGISWFRVIYMMPLLVPGVASAVAWSVLFNTGNGWINYFASVVGLPQLNWAGGTHTAMPTVIIANAWAGIPIITIILLAGLLSLPKDPVEAARIDGASELRVLYHVTLPALRPVLAFAALFQMVNLFREFAAFAIITGGGPGLATSVLNYYVYQTTFVFGELGLGAALAVLLVGVMAVPLLVIFKLSKRGSVPKWRS